MREQLERHIKPLMEEHPSLGALLERAGIGCATCSLGTCRVRDILEIHNLDETQTRQLLQAMGEVIYGGEPFEVPEVPRQVAPPKAAFCPPIARLVEEHTYIKRLIACLPALVVALRADGGAARPLAERVLEFIRIYADRYHHAKEEDILFGFLDPDAEVLQVMLQDHADGRAHVKAVAQGLADGDWDAVEQHLQAYGMLLTGHIQREDTILYPWIDRTLSDRQVGQLFSACREVEKNFGAVPAEQEAFVKDLESKLKA